MAHTNGHVNGKCVECAVPQLARNHYFTGKLLVERDFREEQEFLLGKHRRHNQALHGWGAVCGLRVKEHPDEQCRRQYVIVEPGTAVDCCGREIVLTREEYFDFRDQIPAEWLLPPENPDEPERHKLQICLRYVECPTEDVPALFDDCGCEDDACRPNRIVESYALELRVDEPEHEHEPFGPRLDRLATLNIDDAWRIAVNEPQRTLHVLTRTEAAGVASYGLTSYDTDDLAQVQPTLGGAGTAKDVAASADGSQLYVAVGTDGGDLEIGVYESGSAVAVNTLTLAGEAEAEVELAAATSGRLYALLRRAADGEVHAWDDPAGDAAPSASSGALGAAARALAVTPDSDRLVVAALGDPELRVLKAEDLTDIETANVDAITTAIAFADTTAGVRLYAGRADGSFRVFDVRFGDAVPFPPLGPALALGTNVPLAIAVSEGGRFAYVLEREDAGTSGNLRAIDTHRLGGAAGPEAPRATFPLAAGLDLALAGGGRRLYAAYDEGDDGFAGVAVVGISEAACEDLFERTIEECPACAADQCIVLATIDDYLPGQPVGDAQIDNLRERRLLPSTTVITDVVRCLLEHGTGAGERGAQGPPGLGINDVTGEFVDGLDPAGVDFDAATRVVNLRVPTISDVTGEVVDTIAEAGVEFTPETGLVHIRVPRGEAGEAGSEGAGVDDVTGTFVNGLGPAGVDFDATTRVVTLRLPTIANVTGEVVDTVPEAGVDFTPATGLVHLRIPRGPQGGAGEAGADGQGIADVTGQFVDGLDPAGVDFDAATRVVDLRVPTISDVTGEVVDTVAQAGVDFTPATGLVHIRVPRGEPGPPGTVPRLALPTIVGLNWPHAGEVSRVLMRNARGQVIRDATGARIPPQIFNDGLVIAFDRNVRAETLDEHTFQVLFRHASGRQDVEMPMFCHCTIEGEVTGLQVEEQCGVRIVVNAPPRADDTKVGPVRGARFFPAAGWQPGEYVVVVYGDFVLGQQRIRIPDRGEVFPALDADHLGPGLPLRCPTGDGVEGGTFRSWFSIV